MYHWYERATVCYAYMADIESRTSVWELGSSAGFDSLKVFRDSRWFTRGWTLQELIAPKSVEFYASDWSEIGTKSSLSKPISEITGVDLEVLRGKHPKTRNIAERMSWASKRQTTREEDMAYCLLGLFQVHMPLLYGEGNRAFLRLQEEILKISEDHTLFAWNPFVESHGKKIGLLAGSVTGFDQPYFRHVYSRPKHLETFFQPLGVPNNYRNFSFPHVDPPRLTSRGLRITLPLLEDVAQGTYSAYIYCSTGSPSPSGAQEQGLQICVTLHLRTPMAHLFVRTLGDSSLHFVRWEDILQYQLRTIFVAQPDQLDESLIAPLTSRTWHNVAFALKTSTINSTNQLSVISSYPTQRDSWNNFFLGNNLDGSMWITLNWGDTDFFPVRASVDDSLLCDIFVYSSLRALEGCLGLIVQLPINREICTDRAMSRLRSSLGEVRVAVRRTPQAQYEGVRHPVYSLEIFIT
jgi:hypothetical protein